MRIGIDVGSTNTDAVLMDGRRVVHAVKTPTTPEVSEGIETALRRSVRESGLDLGAVTAVMIGTTHFTNAVAERKHLQQTACIRLGLPATASLPPMIDWPDELRRAVGGHGYLAHGGHEFDGRELSGLDQGEIAGVARQIRDRGITAVAISSVFSPVSSRHEERAGEIVKEAIPDADVTLSSSIGRIGLLERENASILNAALGALARRTVEGFKEALANAGIRAPFYLTQNDGTLMSGGFAARYPVLTFASGATNSMRGAAFLTGAEDAVAVDVGGTTTDVGLLRDGFPRVASSTVSIGGVRTNFRIPDTHSVALGGGSIIGTDPLTIGPRSVGYELTSKALVFGGDTLTATDIVVAAGVAELGTHSLVSHLDSGLIGSVEDRIEAIIVAAVDRVRTNATRIPAIVVGGGSILIQRDIAGTSETLKPEHYAVANAIGAAIAQVGGTYDGVFSLDEISRDSVLETARREAVDRAVIAGAARDTVEIMEIDEVPLGYLPGNATRITVRAVGDLARAG